MTTSPPLNPKDLRSAIARNPPMVTSDTTVMAAIAKMAETSSNYVLVVESTHPDRNSLIGILTERDLIRLSTQPIPLGKLSIRVTMSHPVVTLKESAFTDLNAALNLCKQHRIRHLPVLDDRDWIVGLLDQDTLIEMANIIERQQAEAALQQLNQDLERKVEQRTAALQASEATNRTMLNAIPDLLLRLKRDGTCLTYIKSEIETGTFLPIANHISEVLPPDLLQKQLQAIAQAIATGELQVYEHSFLKQDRTIYEEVRILAINDREVLAIVRDISDRKQAEAELRVSEERLKLALEAAGDGLWDWNVTTGYLYLSLQWLEMLGFKPDELPSDVSVWEQLVHPDDKPWVMERLNAHFQDATVPYKFDYRVQAKTGEYYWIANYGKVVVRDRQGKPLRMIGTHRDITASKQTEERLRKSDAHLKTAQRIGKLGSWEFDLRTKQTTWSEEVFRIFGRDLAAQPPSFEELWQQIHPDDLDHQQQMMQKAIETAQPYRHEYRLYHPNGKLRYIQVQGETILDAMGQPAQLVGTVHDITDRKQAEAKLRQLNQELENRVERRTAALQQSEAHLRDAQQVAHLGSWNLDLLNQKLIWSAEVFKIFGLDPEQPEPTFNELLNYYPLDERQRVTNLVDRAIQYGEPFETDLAIIRADGSSGYTFVKAEPVRDGTGQVIGLFGITMDISDRKATQEALKHSEERARATLLALPDLVFRVNRDGQYMDFLTSPQGKNLVDPHQAIGKSIYDALPAHIVPTHTETKYAALQQALATQTLQTYEQQIWIEGKLRYEEVRVAPCNNDEVVFFVRDISIRKFAEQENQLLKERLQFVLSTNPAVIFTCKLDGDYGTTFISDNAQNLFGYTPAEFTTESSFWVDRVHLDDVPLVLAKLPQVLDRAHLIHEYRFRHQNGYYLLLRAELSLVRDPQGIPIEMVGYLVDISDRKAVEIALEKSQAQFHRLTENIPGMVYRYVLHPDGSNGLTYVSPVVRDIFELEPEAVVQNIDLLRSRIHPEDIPHIQTGTALSAKNLEPFYLEYRIITPSGGKWVQSISRPELQENGDILWDGVMLDISDRKQVEAQLQQTNQELIRATLMKDEFLANMSHELRTPLNAILGMTEGLQEQVFGTVNERQLKALRTVESSGNHLLELINDILDIAKIESGKMELDCTLCAVSGLCQSSLAFIKQQALKKRIQLEIKLQLNLPELLVDERRIRQVLINLLSNAMKFTPEGGRITLEANQISPDLATTDAPPQHFLRIAVIDTGIGISPENIKKLFQPFIQIDSALNRQYEGTGLGLALVKRTVELHGGSVELTSELGVGSCFSIYLPFNPDASFSSKILANDRSVATPELVSPVLNAANLILLAEDNEANISTVSSYLEAKGYRLLVARNGQDAIALAKAYHPNLILMDIQMPIISGLEAIKQIRLDLLLVKIPIIVLTALAMTGDRERCIEAGATEYLTKPLRMKELSQTIQTLLAE